MTKQLTPQQRDTIARTNISDAALVVVTTTYGKPAHAAAVGAILRNIPDLIESIDRVDMAKGAGRFSAPLSALSAVAPEYITLQAEAVRLWSEGIRQMAADPRHRSKVERAIIAARNESYSGSLLEDAAMKTEPDVILANTARAFVLAQRPASGGGNGGVSGRTGRSSGTPYGSQP